MPVWDKSKLLCFYPERSDVGRHFRQRYVVGKIRSIFCQLPVWRNGRRARLKIEYSQGCGGSSPLSGTIRNPERGFSYCAGEA